MPESQQTGVNRGFQAPQGGAAPPDPSPRAKARRLHQLHDGSDLLVLPNIWNPIGAKLLEAEGYPAVATASAAVSSALGYADGERILRSTLLDVLSRVARSVSVPVTADIEGGYGASMEDLRETIRLVLEAGVVGVNLEDSMTEGVSRRSLEDQCDRLSAAREEADAADVPLFINARIDAFAMEGAIPEEALDDTVERASAYVEAGADCVYPMGPADEDTVRALRERIQSPINILVGPHALPLRTYREIGVERVSFGPFVFRAGVGQLMRIARELRTEGTYHSFGRENPSGADLAPLLEDEGEV